MTSIINKSFTTLIVFLLFSGCLSLPQNEDSESKLECEEKIILSHEDLVERVVKKSLLPMCVILTTQPTSKMS